MEFKLVIHADKFRYGFDKNSFWTRLKVAVGALFYRQYWGIDVAHWHTLDTTSPDLKPLRDAVLDEAIASVQACIDERSSQQESIIASSDEGCADTRVTWIGLKKSEAERIKTRLQRMKGCYCG